MSDACDLCHGTGTIETGNNDLPCSCELGDSARFNVGVPGGVVDMSGAELREHLRATAPEVRRRLAEAVASGVIPATAVLPRDMLP